LQDLSGVGYDHLLKGGGLSLAQRKGRTKRQLVQEIRRLRKVGNVPPVYPNGWFCLLESTELAAGEVKHVAALGNYQKNDCVIFEQSGFWRI
jgi:cholesterol 7-dehydrogenase